ncbi:membrane dipeptidase [Parabacteroides sp.]
MRKLVYTAICACSLLYGAHAQTPGSEVPDLKKLYELTDSCDVNVQAPYSPLIGLSASISNGASRVTATYIQSIVKAGGTPIIIPAVTDGKVLRNIVSSLDGLVLIGGADVNPLWYGEDPRQELATVDPVRDLYELKLIKLATDQNVPILGICRGLQLLNVAFGGTLYQDIPSQRKENYIKHDQQLPNTYGSHRVYINPGSQLAAILGKDTVTVNSSHHQSIKDLAPIFKKVACAPDSIIEAIDAYPNRPILGVQWHPEGLTYGGDTTMLKIFRHLVGKADTFHLAKEMHKRFLSVDTHTDTPFWFKRAGFSIADRERNRVNIPKMQEGKLDGVFLAAFIGQGKRDEASSQEAVRKVNGLIEGIHRQAEMNKDVCGIAVTTQDLARLKNEGKKAFFIGIENGYGIGKDLANIAKFKAMGVNYITLCHSYDNDICDSSTHTKKEWDGLSPFGEEVVKEMNRQGIMVDMSHASEKSFWDVIKLSKAPIICSHSSSMAMCKHDRNLTDEQLKALAQNGGVAQVCLLDRYINEDYKNASLTDAVEHIDHMVKVAGIDHVGIGSDFDGGGGIIGCESDNDFIQITVKLIEKGYSEEDIAKIWGGNLLRVLDEVQATASVKTL